MGGSSGAMGMGGSSGSPVRVAVIGLGYWGPNLARNAAASPFTELVALCDQDVSRMTDQCRLYPAAQPYSDLDKLLAHPDLEAVMIATSPASHFAIANKAIEAGLDVLVEKPMAMSYQEADTLALAAEFHQRVLMIDHVYLYSPAVIKLADLYRNGALGDLRFIDSVRINLGIIQHDVDVVWDLAPHDLSIIDHIVGRMPVSVSVATSAGRNGGAPNLAHLHLDYGDGVLASIHVNWLSPVKIRHMLVAGSRQSLLYNDLDPSEPIKVYNRGVDISEDQEDRRRVQISYRTGDVVSPEVSREEPLSNALADFARCVATRSTPCANSEHGLRIVRILEAADLSRENSGSPIRVDHA